MPFLFTDNDPDKSPANSRQIGKLSEINVIFFLCECLFVLFFVFVFFLFSRNKRQNASCGDSSFHFFDLFFPLLPSPSCHHYCRFLNDFFFFLFFFFFFLFLFLFFSFSLLIHFTKVPTKRLSSTNFGTRGAKEILIFLNQGESTSPSLPPLRLLISFYRTSSFSKQEILYDFENDYGFPPFFSQFSPSSVLTFPLYLRIKR